MENDKTNSYIDYIDRFAEKYHHKNDEYWKDLEKFLDYVLDEFFLPSGERWRWEVGEFKYSSFL